jgi:hypothetical protein
MKLLMIAVLMSASATVGSANGENPKSSYHKDMSAEEKASCIRKGGKIARFGLLQTEGCLLAMRDAGKVCTDGSQCQAGACEANGARPARPRETVRGVCPADNNGFGCRSWIIKSRATPAMCAD